MQTGVNADLAMLVQWGASTLQDIAQCLLAICNSEAEEHAMMWQWEVADLGQAVEALKEVEGRCTHATVDHVLPAIELLSKQHT